MKKYIIVRQSPDGGRQGITLPYDEAARTLMNASGYVAYVAEHGYHFTAKLAAAESAKMTNVDGTDHRWGAAEMEKAIQGRTLPERTTLGDMLYLANMAYADFYPAVLNTEEACISYAAAVANDPDGYDGMPFLRWSVDLIGKGITVDWEKLE